MFIGVQIGCLIILTVGLILFTYNLFWMKEPWFNGSRWPEAWLLLTIAVLLFIVISIIKAIEQLFF